MDNNDKLAKIERACSTLRSKINTKYPNNKRLKDATHHACHILVRLEKKIGSLDLATTSLKDLSDECVDLISKKSYSIESLQRIFMHWFRQYLRLRDGLVFLVSGECRHVADRKKAKAALYPSRLTKKSPRNDGTRVYREDAYYNGFGWDEFFDDEVGVRIRMIEALGGTSSGERRVDRLLETIDMLLSDHEARFKSLEESIEQIKNNFIRSTNKCLRKYHHKNGIMKLSVKGADKFEKLELKGIFEFHRMADNFSIKERGGVLPVVKCVSDWKRAMKIPSNLRIAEVTSTVNSTEVSSNYCTKKESGSTFEEDLVSRIQMKKNQNTTFNDKISEGKEDALESKANERKSNISNKPNDKLQASHLSQKLKASSTTGGLKVKYTSTLEQPSASGVKVQEFSVTSIKEKLGVKNDIFETSLDALQVESNGGDDQEIIDIETDIAHYKEELKRFKKELKTASDDIELWNVKEGLRETSMRLGSMLLDLADIVAKESHRKETTKAANHARDSTIYFEYANAVILSLQESAENNYDDKYDNTLLLLKARAQVNIIISVIRQIDVRESKTQTNIDSPIPELLKKVKRALKDMNRTTSDLITDTKLSGMVGKSNEISLLHIQAVHLQSIMCRMKAKAHWLSGQYQAAIYVFESASQKEHKKPMYYAGEPFSALKLSLDYMDEIHLEILAISVERYVSAISLTNMAASFAEERPATCSQGKDSVDTALKAFDNAVELREEIVEMLKRHQCYEAGRDSQTILPFLLHNGILSKESLLISRNELQSWWTNRQKSCVKSFSDLRQTNVSMNHNNSITLNFPSAPTLMLTLNHSNSERLTGARGKCQQTKWSNLSLRRQTSRGMSIPDQGPSEQEKNYRLWGDERLECCISYPAIAPPRPTQ